MTEKIASLSVSNNLLVAVAATQEPAAGSSPLTFCIIDITHTDNNAYNRIATLASGYLGGSFSIGWTGRILMEPEMIVNIRCFSAISFPVRLSMITEI
ncbi:MAG: hypothetical protein KAR39_12390 [Thermoplasmata archaeon]|nr:hypothetical protein [Thermoplasmata archaeon]